MACPLPCRKAPDGTKVAIIVLDNVNADRIYRTAADLRVEWDGDPDDLGPCICPPATYSCTASAETASIGATAIRHVLQQRELARGQKGFAVSPAFILEPDPQSINPTDIPYDIPIPAHAAGSVLALFVAYGGDSTAPNGTNTIEDPSITLTGSDVSAPQIVWDTGPDAPVRDVGGFLVYMNGLTGNAGSTLTLDFGTFDIPTSGNKPGVFTWVLNEYTSDQPSITIADMDLANNAPVEVDPSTTASPAGEPPLRTHAAVDLGECDGLFYGYARHVREDNDDGTRFYDADWSTMTTGGAGYEELQDISSIDRATVCQLGLTAGLVRGNNGPTAFSYQQNYHWSQFSGERMAAGLFVPTVCPTAAGDDQFEEVCEVVAVNHCPGDAVSVMCRLVAEVEMTVEAGDTLTVTPFINGVAITSAAQTVTTSGTVSIDASAAGADIPDGGADTTHTFYLELSGVGSASANAWEATCTTTQL